MSDHPIDQWDEDIANAAKEAKKQAMLESSLVYAVFDTGPGKKLIAKWTELLVNYPSAKPGMDMLEIGMNEGEKRFVRSIINAINTHEEE